MEERRGKKEKRNGIDLYSAMSTLVHTIECEGLRSAFHVFCKHNPMGIKTLFF